MRWRYEEDELLVEIERMKAVLDYIKNRPMDDDNDDDYEDDD
jgi:hypothetical protein